MYERMQFKERGEECGEENQTMEEQGENRQTRCGEDHSLSIRLLSRSVRRNGMQVLPFWLRQNGIACGANARSRDRERSLYRILFEICMLPTSAGLLHCSKYVLHKLGSRKRNKFVYQLPFLRSTGE
jgi:hypothetical protein